VIALDSRSSYAPLAHAFLISMQRSSNDCFASPNSIDVFESTKRSFLDAGKPFAATALHYDRILGVEHVEDGHAVNRRRRVGARRWIDDVVRTHHQHDVGLFKSLVDIVHIDELVAGDARFGQIRGLSDVPWLRRSFHHRRSDSPQ